METVNKQVDTRFERAAKCLNAENKLINLNFDNPVMAAQRGRQLQAQIYRLNKEW